jgi:membrane-associated PAP2 superfamily phosphatase
VDPRSTVQDLTHTIFAVLGFAAACYAMLQVAFSRRRPRVARLSLVSSIAVGVISGAGGVLALVHIAVDFGAWLEFAGMTVAIAWLATYGMALVVEGRERAGIERLDPEVHERMHGEAPTWPGRQGLSESA